MYPYLSELGALVPADIMTITSDASLFLWPFTIVELYPGSEVAREAGIRQKHLASLHRLLRKLLLTIDVETGVIFGALAAAIKMAGRSHCYRVPYWWLASRAIQRGPRFLTQNGRDFTDVPGLGLVVLPSGTG